jgi:hypothetical protein
MYLVDWKEILPVDDQKEILPVNEVHGSISFRSTRYKYLAGWKETLPAGLGYPLGYPPAFCGKGAICIRWRVSTADSGYPRRMIPDHLYTRITRLK